MSSCFILDRDCGEEGLKRIAMGDCAVNIDYTDTVDKATGEVKISAASKLAEVAVETARTAKLFGIDPKVAVLSFSTKGSGKGGTVALSHDATIKAQEMDPELAVDGELQFDAAVAPEVAQVKCKGSKVAGQANTFIFPCIEAGNIGYKIAQRLGGYAAYGPGRTADSAAGKAGLSQDTLAEQLGVSRQSVSKWENDASVPDLEKLVKLSGVFGVSLDELVKGEVPDSAAPAVKARRDGRGTSAHRQRLVGIAFFFPPWCSIPMR